MSILLKNTKRILPHKNIKLRVIDFVKLFVQSRNRVTSLGFLIVIIFFLEAVFSPWIAPYSPDVTNFNLAYGPPSWSHWFGLDNLGRDIFSRVIWGARGALESAILVVGIAMAIGVPVGLVSGFMGGFIDEIIMRFVDAGLAFPGLVLAMAISWIVGPSLLNASIAVAVTMIPQFIRLIRGQVLSLKERDYVLAAQTIGASRWHIMWHHILLNSLPPLIVSATMNMAYGIMIVASLSFLGLGPPPPYPSWGEMLNTGSNYLSMAPWMSLFPGIAIFLLILGFTLLGDGLRDILSPQNAKKTA